MNQDEFAESCNHAASIDQVVTVMPSAFILR